MKTCRKSVATVLLLLIHLLTLQIDDAVAGRNASDVKRDPRVILEEVIITGSGNNTRVTANAVAEEPSKIGDEIISLLSKRNARRRRLKQTSSDQDADQSHAVAVNAENDEDLERLKRVIAKYEPQRITSRKTKRKIVDGTHDIHDKTIRSNTDLEKIYHEVLRNISRTAPELMVSNANVTFIPSYLSQVIKNLGQIHTPGATIHPASDVGATKTSRFDIDTSPTAKNKKKSIFKKYLQLNRTTASPRISSIEEVDKETADSNESGTAKGYFKAPGARAKNESSESLLSTAEKPESPRKWNAQESPARIAPAFDTQLNNSNAYNIFNAKNSIVPSDVNSLHLLSKYNVAPRPFSILQSPGAPVATNLNILYRKPSVPPTGFNHRQLVRSSANILPLVLPTELFSPPPARYYIPIKRTNHINVDESPATIVSTEANPPASVAKGRTVFDKPSADYSASYADVIGTTKSPLIAANNPRSSGSSDYYAVTENPAETAYVPSQASPSYTLQRQKNPQTVNKNEFLPKIATYDNPEKSDLNANLELALYNKFARLYSVDRPNVFNVPKVIVQDYQDKQPVTSQQVSTLPYSTLKPISPTLLKVQPAKPAVAPYYESRLFASQDGKELNDKDNGESVETNERSRVKNADEAEGEADDDKDNFTNYKTRIDHGASKIRKTPDEQREKEDREETEKEDYHTRDYEHQDKYSKNNKNDKNNDAREKYENIRHENNKDEEDVETHEDEHVSAGEDEHDQDYRHPYDKYEHDRDDSEEQQDNKSEKKDNKSDEQRYEKRGKENDNRDKHDYEADFKYGLESSNKYSDSRYNDDKTREDVGKFYGNKESDDDRPKKNRQDRKHEDSEEENVAEDKLYTQRSDERVYRQRERNEKKHNKSGDTTHKRKYRPQTIPRKDSRPEEYKREEYSEINPRHVRKEYHNQQQQQHVKNNNNNNQRGHRKYDSGNQDIDNEKLRDHVHGETKEHAHKHEEHHEKKKDGGNHKFEKGEGAEHEEEHHGQEGEEGKKGYKVWHENEKAEKGHHDKEHASKEYDEKNGEKKNHEEEGGYHEQQHHGEEGKKTAEFGEKGEHKKGHSTHGEHSVHKKDEYEKKTEFFDEFHEDDGTEKHGEHHHEHESKKGGHEKKAHHDAADHEAKYGKEDKHEKGGHHHEHKGHKADEGHDHHYDHHEKHGKKEGHEHGKKWSYKEGDGGGGAGGDHKHNR
ncbi:ankyrin repeat domain-containing protein 11-like [Linepithema humile]|uniref:ankyrin repeat domain-containing protein 11-like n=1 Tax=Linepithema humile TaxID=83485 RepID=UPI00351F3801